MISSICIGKVEIPIAQNLGSVHIDDTPPQSVDQLWIDFHDEDGDDVLKTGSLMEEIRSTVGSVSTRLSNVEYAFTHEIDSGYFKDRLPGTDPDVIIEPGEGAPDLGDGTAGTCQHIVLLRGLKQDIDDLKEGELGFCLDSEELYIGNKGQRRLLAKVGGTGSSGSGSGNVTSEYVELIADDGTKYKLTVNKSGQVMLYESSKDNAILPAQTETGRFAGLFINKVYGGGARNTNTTPVSHSFIELYNSTDNEMNLHGLTLQYGEYLTPWQSLKLRGVVKPYSSFLIRCAQHTDPNRYNTRFKILDYDMNWDVPISPDGFKVYLSIPASIDSTTPYINPANTDGAWTKELGFIDLFGVGGEDVSKVIDGYDAGYLNLANKYRMIKRKYSEDVLRAFSCTNDNSYDLEYLDMREADVEIYAPRPSSYGQWTFYFNQVTAEDKMPFNISIGFGKNGDTDRTFTWHTKKTRYGALKYKKHGELAWTTVKSANKFVAFPDYDVTIHSAVAAALTPGVYAYKVGEDGYWSDEADFEVVDALDTTRTISFVHISDQQGWDEYEYTAWEKANAFIEKNETYDFLLNTGDVSQNANRSFEWRYFFDMARSNLRSHVHMTCIGNNDLVDKISSEAYTYYSTSEQSKFPSVYSFNYGYVHFICLDSNLKERTNTTEIEAWLTDDLDYTEHPENQKRWTIVYMHESPYTIIRNAKLMKLHKIFATKGVDLVLCGHHHRYSRSYKLGPVDISGADVIVAEDAPGVKYVMCQATGIKIMGKTDAATTAPWRAYMEASGMPTYIKWDITYNSINMHPYRLDKILPLIDCQGKEPEAYEFDAQTPLLTKS